MSNVVKLSYLFLVLAMTVPASAALVFHLDFDDPNEIGKDNVGYTLQVVGDAAYTADGKIGGGLLLDGDDDYLQLNDYLDLPAGVPTGNGSFTTAAFFKTTAAANNGIVGWGEAATHSFNGLRTGYKNEILDVRHYNWGSGYDCKYTVNYTDGQWHHLAATYDASTSIKTLYLDGIEVDTLMFPEALTVGGTGFTVGSIRYTYNTNFRTENFNGTLDDVRIYNSALTASEINDLIPAIPDFIPGDANNDKKVDGSDVTILAGNWQVGVGGVGGATWGMGDFNGDGAVDGSDVTILAGNWQYGVETAAASVPEPGSVILLISAMASLLIWRRAR